jgi:cytochrome c oxidase subunit 3
VSAIHVHEQFDDAAQQRHAATLGMWLFLATEVLVFSVLFTAYTVARAANPQAFHEAGHHLYKWIGVGNAAVLLLSSTAMAVAVETPRSHQRRRSAWMLGTALLGTIFLGVKAVEYTLDIHESLLPLVRFDGSRFLQPARSELFLVFYWAMTALHALHVLGGVCVIALLALRVRRALEPERLDNAVHAAGLYWHFVDIVWLFILPLLYLNP